MRNLLTKTVIEKDQRKINQVSRTVIFVFGFTLLLTIVSVIQASAQIKELPLIQIQQTPTTVPTPDPTIASLEKAKLELEVQQLQIENENNDRDFFTWQGFRNLIFSNVSVALAALAGLAGLLRYLEERNRERIRREEESFEEVVTNLANERIEARIGAAVILLTFLDRKYERFFVQVFNLTVSNLALRPTNAFPEQSQSERLSPPPFIQALTTVFQKSYVCARNLLNSGSITRTLLKRQTDRKFSEERLNATGINLDNTFLQGTDLNRIFMRQSSLRYAVLKGAKLNDATLEKSNLFHADLSEAELKSSNLKGIIFDEALLESADLSDSRVDGASFRKANLTNIMFSRCTASGTDFLGADLKGARFIGVDFKSVDEQEKQSNPEFAANLKGAKFVGVTGMTQQQKSLCANKGASFFTSAGVSEDEEEWLIKN